MRLKLPSWETVRTILCFWYSLPWLLRWRYAETAADPPEALVLVGAANRTDGRTSPQGEAMVERARRYLASIPPSRQLPLVLCVSGNIFGGRTEAEALAREVTERIGQKLQVKTVVLDPLPDAEASALGQLKPLLEPHSLTRNTWENVWRVLDYCRMKGIHRVTLVCHPVHGTWALPLARHSAAIVRYKLEVGLLNSNQRRYDRTSPQRRLRSAAAFYAYGVLAKGKQLLNGWCVLPYIRPSYRG